MVGGINLASLVQVSEYLYDQLGFEEVNFRGKPNRTASGRRKADSETIHALKATTPEQRAFKELYSEYRNLDSLLSKNLNFFKDVCNGTGRFYASLNQGRTGTHRLSSSGRVSEGVSVSAPQFQNLPRPFKPLFWS